VRAGGAIPFVFIVVALPLAWLMRVGRAALAQFRWGKAALVAVLVLLFALIGLGLAIALLVGLILMLGQQQPPVIWVALWVVALSLTAFFIYGFDKAQAQRGGLRVPEAILHLLSLLGGSPGAFVAMRVFHHKTSKRSFQAVFWLIVAVQLGVLAYLLLR